MKSRSNRHPASDPPDDWVDGSWTVDCICGVTFDDGEEMVNCDECGVWVHTRCFRFVKGEKSFACDKCKKIAIRNHNNHNNANDSEETEVAQLLVELPTKTIKMSSNNSHSNSINHNYGNSHSNNHVYSFGNPPPPPSRRTPYRLWVNRPMEERVHVQGVPGGDDDPSIFQGFPIVFASELWKCTGYVPKKFNFSYKEFPCWDKEEGVEVEANGNADVDAKVEVGVENVVDKGAGVLYSLSKENVMFSLRKGQDKSGGSHRKESKEKKWDNIDSKKISVPSLSKKDKGIRRPVLVQCSGKRSRDDLGSSKDRSGKKKVKAIPREQDSKKDKAHGIKAVTVHSSIAKQTEVYEGKGHKGASNVNLAEAGNKEKPKRTVSSDEGNAVLRSPEVSGLRCLIEKRVKDEKPGDDATSSDQNPVNNETTPLLVAEKDGSVRNAIRNEGVALDAMEKTEGTLLDCQTNDLSRSKPVPENVDNDTLECNNNEVAKGLEITVSSISGHCASETKKDANVDYPQGVTRSDPPDIDVELEADGKKLGTEQVFSPDLECDVSKLNEAVATSSQSREHDVQDSDKTVEVASGSLFMQDEGANESLCNNNVKCEGSENPVEVQNKASDTKEVTRVAEETSKRSGEILPPPISHRKTIPVGKSSPCSSTFVTSRSSVSDKNRDGNSNFIGKRAPSNSSLGTKKESAPPDQVKDEVKYEISKNKIKDHLKSSTNPTSKASVPSKSVTSPVLKHHTSLGKDSLRHPFSKKSAVESASHSSGIVETAGSVHTQHASTGQNKCTASGGQHRNEKVSQPNLQSSSKPTQSSSGHPPPSSGAPGLSDEELALLLHQELNSSPRVPRVPRVRNAGSLPQYSSASATSMLIKRGTSGGKEQHTFTRRKNKDGSRSSREQESEARKVDRAPSSPDSAKTSDALTQAEGQSEAIHSVRKNADDISTSAANSGPSSTDANELKSSSTRDSPVNNPEDDTGTNKGLPLIHRTLPGLIAEIMGAGRRMTYEELCNAVLPHWQNLRKHNGERYAYSSHSQAVLDCLRNRSEWARLVDRGPKTNASRKKRKIDVEPPNTESEDGEDRAQRNGKSKSFESNKEEFPKGRRKARKRRRLALRGRGVRDDRKRTKVVARSDDSGSLSNFSEDSGSSEDDSQGSGLCAAKSEISASSADLVAGQ